MLEAGSPEEAARILTNCGYPELETVSAITVGEMLNRERERLFQDLAELVPDPAILAVFQLPHDYHNVKVLLKSEAMGIQEDRLLVDAGRIPSKQLVAALRSGEVQNLPPQLGEAIDEARQVRSWGIWFWIGAISRSCLSWRRRRDLCFCRDMFSA